MAFDKFKDLWNQKERSFKRIDSRQSLVIFMDCKDVTSDHSHFDQSGSDPIYRIMADCAYRVAVESDLSCTIYAAIDEVSIIFSDPKKLVGYFRVGDCADYLCSLYLQRFLRHFWKYYPKINLKSTVFPLSQCDTGRYLQYRKEVAQTVAMFYVAKQSLPASKYRDLPFSSSPVRRLLEDEGLMDILAKNKDFFNGIKKEYFSDNLGDWFADCMRLKK